MGFLWTTPSRSTPTRPALIAVDVDGTLLTSRHELTAATVAEVARVRRHGVEVVLASSRGPTAMRAVLLELGLTTPALFVGSQGAIVGCYDQDGTFTLVDRTPAPLLDAQAVVSAAVRRGLAVNWFSREHWLVSHVAAGWPGWRGRVTLTRTSPWHDGSPRLCSP